MTKLVSFTTVRELRRMTGLRKLRKHGFETECLVYGIQSNRKLFDDDMLPIDTDAYYMIQHTVERFAAVKEVFYGGRYYYLVYAYVPKEFKSIEDFTKARISLARDQWKELRKLALEAEG